MTNELFYALELLYEVENGYSMRRKIDLDLLSVKQTSIGKQGILFLAYKLQDSFFICFWLFDYFLLGDKKRK